MDKMREEFEEWWNSEGQKITTGTKGDSLISWQAARAKPAEHDTMQLAEMVLSDCGISTVISDRLQRRVAERIQRHVDGLLAAMSDATGRSTCSLLLRSKVAGLIHLLRPELPMGVMPSNADRELAVRLMGEIDCLLLDVELDNGPDVALKDIARAIWNIRRDDEDRCDMELEDMPHDHSVWREAAAVQALLKRWRQMIETTISLEEVKAKLKADGYGGLHFDGECACELNDLAPCGECQHEDDEPYINGCEGGYKHIDPTRPYFWVISVYKEPPTQEQFDKVWESCQ